MSTADRFRRARETTPPRVEEVSRWLLDSSPPAPITLRLNDRTFRLPPGTRFWRHGLTHEGLLVEYQAGDGAWERAEETTREHD